MFPRREPFSVEQGSAVGDSILDVVRGYRYGLETLRDAVNSRGPFELDCGGARIKIVAKWVGEREADRATTEFGAHVRQQTYCTCARIAVSVVVRRPHMTTAKTTFDVTLEIPRIVGDGDYTAMPPESGYFSVHGREFVLRSQERFVFSHWLVMVAKRGRTASLRSPARYPGDEFTLHRILAERKSGELLLVFKDRAFKVTALARALGEETCAEFVDRVASAPFRSRYQKRMEDAWFDTEEDARASLVESARAGVDGADVILDTWLLGHLGTRAEKLDSIAHGLARFVGDAVDDFDHFGNKRLDTAGDLLAFRACAAWSNVFLELGATLSARKGLPAVNAEAAKSVSECVERLISRAGASIAHAFLAGNWSGADGKAIPGASDSVKRLNAASVLALMRTTRSALGTAGSKKQAPRMHHGSALGFVCVVATPDDEHIGLVKSLASSCRVSRPTETDWVPRGRPAPRGRLRLLLNGHPFGWLDDSAAYRVDFKAARAARMALCASDEELFRVAAVTVSLVAPACEVRVWSDFGRFVRPLWCLGAPGVLERYARGELEEPGTRLFDHVRAGEVEFVDPAMSDDAEGLVIAVSPAVLRAYHTHAELHPIFHLGLIAASIPFSQHNQATRNSFQCGQAKQALGVPHAGWLHRDITAQGLCYPQRPLVTTRASAALRQADEPAGVNLICAIACCGNNQEDALIMNLDAVERGLFTSVLYETHRQSTCQAPPPEATGKQRTRLDVDGTLAIHETVEPGHALAYDGEEHGVKNSLRTAARVHSVTIANPALINTPHCSSVRLEQFREPEVGDKFCSRHGQKGLVGRMVPSNELPFTDSGMQPDIVFNPHGLPSRMTVAQIYEMLAGAIAVTYGSFFDATPFESPSLQELRAALERAGKDPGAGVVLYDRWGVPLPGRYILAPIYYSRLYHQVRDKWMAQSSISGALDPRTGQPVRGAMRNGALRFGEMEKDAIVSWGMAISLYERFLSLSDGTCASFCNECGLVALDIVEKGNQRGTRKFCRRCAVRAARRGVPYLPRITTQYIAKSTMIVWATLAALGIALRATFEDEAPSS